MSNVKFGQTDVFTYQKVQAQPETGRFDLEKVQRLCQEAVDELEDLSTLFEEEEESSKNATKANREYHRESILDLQREHQQNGIHDEKGIESLSRALSKKAVKQAQHRASADAITAFEIHSEDSLGYLRVATAEEYAQKTGKRISISKRRSFEALANAVGGTNMG